MTSNRWQRVTERVGAPGGSPDTPIDFVLTPAEKDAAAMASIHLERQRREANARDASRRTPK